MNNHFRILTRLAAALMLTLACSSLGSLSRKTVTLGIFYSSDKLEWLAPLAKQYNADGHETASGSLIHVEATPMGSLDAANAILRGDAQPIVWSPSSDLYLAVANGEWRRQQNGDLYTGTPQALAYSPLVIAMWRPMAMAMGWPEKPIGWADIDALAASDRGWAGYGHPEWGQFKLGHAAPDYSSDGFAAVVAEAYAGAKKTHGLTTDDLDDPEVLTLIEGAEARITHSDISTRLLFDSMLRFGPSYLSAAVVSENLVVEQEMQRIKGHKRQLPTVAIYPKDGTFLNNHPYIILNGAWVTAEEKEAAWDFQAFLLAKPQQQKALAIGFRPADVSIPLTTPLSRIYGADPSQPKTVFSVPGADVLTVTDQIGRGIRRPIDLVVVVDASDMMAGDKIEAVRQHLSDLIARLGDQDRLEIIVFNDRVNTLTALSPLGEKRGDILQQVSGITAGGRARLYDAISQGHSDLQAHTDPDRIQAIVVFSYGDDTASATNLIDLSHKLSNPEDIGSATRIFAIAFGDKTAQYILEILANHSRAKMHIDTPNVIDLLYTEITKSF